jgi:hypothetical protein
VPVLEDAGRIIQGSSAIIDARRRSPSPNLQQQLDQRTRERDEALKHLAEALEQQTATSDVLQVISSSPGELEPVFETMLANAARICEATFGNMYLREGEFFRIAAAHNTPLALVENRRRVPLHPSQKSPVGRMAKIKQAVHVADLSADQTYVERDPEVVAGVELGRRLVRFEIWGMIGNWSCPSIIE